MKVAASSRNGNGEHSAEALPVWKRTLDLICLLLSSPFAFPLSIAIALYIKLSSAGPVLFRQTRVGYGGRIFMCYKFRTMRAGAETESHRQHLHQLMKSESPMTKMDDTGDARVIPLGRLLRASGLDELPQLINVWRGEMSLVGPRPCLEYEYESYSPEQKKRFNAVPGLTGLWQVSGKNRLTFNEMIQMDVAYSQRKSLWLDLVIMAKTPPVLLEQVATRKLSRKNQSNNSSTGTRRALGKAAPHQNL